MHSLFMRFPGGVPKALTFSYDDGVESDISLMKILDKYGMKATFNINAGCFAPEGTEYPPGTVRGRMSKSECLKAYSEGQHEVAVHGYTHPFLDKIPPAVATTEIIDDRKYLENMYSKFIRGGAYPFGAYNDVVVEILKNAGLVYFRTTKATHSFDIPDDWLRLHPTCHHNDEMLFELADRFMKPANNMRASQLFYVWGHTYEFDRDDNWDLIEKFCEKISVNDDIWYCTNIELYDYIDSYNRLRFSADMKLVYNPSVSRVWFDYNNNSYVINPDETIEL